MVLQKRSNFGFNGYQIPAMPRGSRSARGRRWGRKNVEENQMYAFELLATVAGNLLLEQENSSGSTPRSPPVKDIVKKEQLDDEKKPFKVEPCDQGSCDEGTLTWKESRQASTSGGGPPPAVPVKSDASAEFRAKKVECPIGSPLQVKKQKAGNGSGGIVSDVFCMEDPMDFDAKPPPLVSYDSSVEVPQYRNHISRSSSLEFKGDMKMLDADEDDDENSSGCTQPSTITSKTFRSQKIGDRRIKKITASKFWKVGPTLLKDGEFYSNESKSMFRYRKMCCTRQRTQRSSFKRRKLFVRSSVSAGLGVKSGVAFNTKSFEKGTQGDADGSDANLHGADNEIWPSLTSQKLSSKSEEYKVKLRIKSFKVPELFIEMPETATVGSLKRTVLETVSAMLENGVRVGVILQGKKVKDDSKTLLQAGIADGDKLLDSLGFSLDPNPSKAPQQLSSPEDPLLLQSPESPQPLARIPAITTSESTVVVASSPDDSTGPPATPPDHPRAERDRYSSRPLAVVGPLSPSPPPPPDDRTPPSKALVPVPSADDGALAMVPLHRKPRSELVQRRIRRPFSVAEVEALVQAVESLGTGRWRDVKIRAFENAKHRTYVDLKDKWKTLVHTARISPQQRRGEPVPQELLDRVLSAHAHWSHQQAKLQAKPHQQLQATEQSMLL